MQPAAAVVEFVAGAIASSANWISRNVLGLTRPVLQMMVFSWLADLCWVMGISANAISLSRMIVSIIVGIFQLFEEIDPVVRLTLIAVLVASDGLDGMLAKRHGSTKAGPMLDVFADMVFVTVFTMPLVWQLPFTYPLGLVYFDHWVLGLSMLVIYQRRTTKTYPEIFSEFKATPPGRLRSGLLFTVTIMIPMRELGMADVITNDEALLTTLMTAAALDVVSKIPIVRDVLRSKRSH